MEYIKFIYLFSVFLAMQIISYGQDLYQVSPLNINTREFIEESAVFYKDGIVFISNRAESAFKKTIDQDGQPLDDIFFSKQKDNKKFAAPVLFSKELRTKYHEGAICFDSTGRTAYFSRIEDGRYAVLYSSNFNGTEWVNIKPIPNINQINYSFIDPCISNDGKKLFFSSNRPGGQGGFDIWVSTLGRSGWGPPKNLGPLVNTDTSEYYPFMHRNGKLYFASNRKGGFGGVDIYWTMEINGKWLPPKALPSPINTRFDDYAYVSDSSDRKGFISIKKNNTSDIQSFIFSFPVAKNPKPIEKNTYRYRFQEESVISDSSTYVYEWDFGDGTKIRGRNLNVKHTFPKPGDYIVSLNVIDTLTGEVALNQASNIFKVRDEIQPVITCSDTVFTNEEIVLDSKNSYLPDFNAPEYYWDLADGSLEKGKIVKHVFIYPGTYKIILSAANKQKDQSFQDLFSVFKTITVIERK